jgi:hypothetical protein
LNINNLEIKKEEEKKKSKYIKIRWYKR